METKGDGDEPRVRRTHSRLFSVLRRFSCSCRSLAPIPSTSGCRWRSRWVSKFFQGRLPVAQDSGVLCIPLIDAVDDLCPAPLHRSCAGGRCRPCASLAASPPSSTASIRWSSPRHRGATWTGCLENLSITHHIPKLQPCSATTGAFEGPVRSGCN